MIKIPDRLADVASKIERGEAVDLRQVATLQAIDLVRAGRQFVVESIEEHEKDYERIKAELVGN